MATSIASLLIGHPDFFGLVAEDDGHVIGTYPGLRRKHFDTFLNEFVFRFNRRFYRHISFETILGITSRRGPSTTGTSSDGGTRGRGVPVQRMSPRLRKTASGTKADGSRRSGNLAAP